MQCCGFLLSIAGFGLGFSIHGSWSTPYPVHRNLGVAVTALGLAQVGARLALHKPNVLPTVSEHAGGFG